MAEEQPLFFGSDSDDEPPAKAPTKAEDAPSSDVVMLTTPPKADFKKLKRKSAAASGALPAKRMRIETSPTDFREIPRDADGDVLAFPGGRSYRFLGSFPGTGWLTASSKFIKLADGEKVTFEHEVFRADPSSSKKKAKEKPNLLINFKNSKGFECGRLVKDQASFVAKLMEMSVVKIEGSVVSIPKKFDSGTDCILSIHVYFHISAFQSLQDAIKSEEKPKKPKDKAGKVKENFRDELKETDTERRFKARKTSLNKLFDSIGLRPIRTNSIIKSQKAAGLNMDSKQDHLAHFAKKPAAKKGKGKADDAVKAEEDEEGDIGDKQVQAIFSRASKNDLDLPERDPPSSFKLDLRPYQKQALQWMMTMEGGEEDARQSLSLHPLYEEYLFPAEGDGGEEPVPFYYSPYSGELSLKFPKASKKCRGGILADEMGLGKTIMMASLIATNTAKAEPATSNDSASNSDEADSDDSNAPYVPSPVKRQTKLSKNNIGRTSSPKWEHSAGQGATLVVCPMTLLHQWQTEIERSIGAAETNVILYYGTGRGDLEDDIEGAGLPVVITSYGTLASEFQKLVGADGKVSKSSRSGLFAIDWYRIILDEAHTIKSRVTNNAKACYALKGKRRWALSGTPITNRLEDLYSLLHFIKLEPWGNFSYFRSFITVPFQNKDPKAIEIVQIILESVLLRREKSMKDRDGQPIVPLPPKNIIEERLDFTDAEREIYNRIYKDARSQFLGYKAEGNVMKNVTAIFAVLMRLRQAVLHPALVLNSISNRAQTEGGAMTPEDRSIKTLIVKYCAGQSQSAKADDVKEEDILKDLGVEAEEEALCLWCNSAPVSPVKLPCGHIGCKECVLNTFGAQSAEGQDTTCEVCEKPAAEDSLVIVTAKARMKTQSPQKPVIKATGTSSTAAIEISDSEDSDGDVKMPLSSQPMVKSGSASSDAGPAPKQVKKLGNGELVTSTKMDALQRRLEQLRREQPLYHAVVFSQFTSYMDLVERMFQREGINHLRLDGSLSQKHRQKVLQEFNNPKKACVLLISLKAGGTGLNLTIADHCILLDFWWNAAIENQAIDRIHRFGQLREVTIIRFIVDQSIEDRMIALQRRKTAIINAGLGSSGGGSAEADFDEIFGLNDEQGSSKKGKSKA